MFRHLHALTPPITIENISLKEIIRNGTCPYDHMLREWAPEKICLRYEDILSNVLSAEALRFKGQYPQARIGLEVQLHQGEQETVEWRLEISSRGF